MERREKMWREVNIMTEEVLQETGENLRDMETFELDFKELESS